MTSQGLLITSKVKLPVGPEDTSLETKDIQPLKIKHQQGVQAEMS